MLTGQCETESARRVANLLLAISDYHQTAPVVGMNEPESE